MQRRFRRYVKSDPHAIPIGIRERLPVRHSREKIHHHESGQLARLAVDIELRIHLHDIDRFYFLTETREMRGLQYFFRGEPGRIRSADTGRVAALDRIQVEAHIHPLRGIRSNFVRDVEDLLDSFFAHVAERENRGASVVKLFVMFF